MIDETVQILDSDLPQDQSLEDGQLFITEEICEHWRASSQWAAALATIGFLWFGCVIVGTFWLVASSFLKDFAWIGVVFLGIVGIWLYFLSQRLYRYSVKVKDAANHSDWDDMEMAFADLKSVYTLYGMPLLCIVSLLNCIVLILWGKGVIAA